MNTVVQLGLVLLANGGTVHDFIPCRVGLEITYRWSDDRGDPTEAYRVDRVLEKTGRMCWRRRTTLEGQRVVAADVFALEHLPDRILNAGWRGSVTAFRPPVLRAPIQNGKKWRFNRMEYRLETLRDGHRTPAGHFASAVRVRAESIPKGVFRGQSVYARNIGLIEERLRDGRWVAIRIAPTAASPPAEQGGEGKDGTGARLVPTWEMKRAVSR